MRLNSKNYSDTVDKQEELVRVLSEPLPTPASVNQETYNQFVSDLKDFYDNRFIASQNSQTLADNITNLLDSYSFVSDDPAYQYKLMKDLYDGYGLDDNDVFSDALYMRERRDNRKLLNSSIKGIALMYMFLFAAKIKYNNSEDLILVQNELRDRYREQTDENTLPESVWAQVEEVKSRSFKFLGQLKVNKVITTNITRHTLTTLLYDYYENFDNRDEIIELNGIFNPTRLVGEAKMVTVSD